MNITALKEYEIIDHLKMLPENKLDDLKNYLDFLFSRYKIPSKKPINLWGAWAKLDFNIDDLENDINVLRKESELNILQRQYHK